MAAYTYIEVIDELTICSDDNQSDAFEVQVNGARGDSLAWIITDTSGNILALPPSPPFDLEGVPAGVCLIWHITYGGDLTGLAVGQNASGLAGCYSLSNPVSVIRSMGAGSELTTAEGLLEKKLCLNDGDGEFVEVVAEGGAGAHSIYLVTDPQTNILAISESPVIYFDGIEEERVLIWNLRSDESLDGVAIGDHAGNLQGCNGLSNAVTVILDASGACRITCLPPATSSTTILSPTSAQLDWPAVPEVYIYTVRYRQEGTINWLYSRSFTSRSTLRNLQPGTTYEYQIQTLCLPEESEQGAVGEFTTPAFAVELPAGLKNRQEIISGDDFRMKIAPNPVVNTLNIQYSLGDKKAIGKLVISHVSGRKVLETNLEIPANTLELDLNTLSDGYYFISLQNGEEIITEKLVKVSN